MAQTSDQARIDKMLQEGKLTQEEATRLRESIEAQRARDEVVVKHLRKRDPKTRRRLVELLTLCGFFLLLGLVGGALWWQSLDHSGTAAVAQTPSAPTSQPEGRLIDLAALTRISQGESRKGDFSRFLDAGLGQRRR